MSLNIKNHEAERLARFLAKKTGESITEVIIEALREKLKREEGRIQRPTLKTELIEISKRCSTLKDLDKRSPDEILGYNEEGFPDGH